MVDGDVVLFFPRNDIAILKDGAREEEHCEWFMDIE
jgi:hypothetical protein